MTEPGARVRVTTKNGLTVEGLVLPADHLVLKLDNGYNIGFLDSNVQEVADV